MTPDPKPWTISASLKGVTAFSITLSEDAPEQQVKAALDWLQHSYSVGETSHLICQAAFGWGETNPIQFGYILEYMSKHHIEIDVDRFQQRLVNLCDQSLVEFFKFFNTPGNVSLTNQDRWRLGLLYETLKCKHLSKLKRFYSILSRMDMKQLWRPPAIEASHLKKPFNDLLQRAVQHLCYEEFVSFVNAIGAFDQAVTEPYKMMWSALLNTDNRTFNYFAERFKVHMPRDPEYIWRNFTPTMKLNPRSTLKLVQSEIVTYGKSVFWDVRVLEQWALMGTLKDEKFNESLASYMLMSVPIDETTERRKFLTDLSQRGQKVVEGMMDRLPKVLVNMVFEYLF